MKNVDTTTWLPYMHDWYKTYEFCSETHIKLGKLSDDILVEIVKEVESQEFFYLPKLPNLDYSGCGLITPTGNKKLWVVKNESIDLDQTYCYEGYIKSVKNINKRSCALNTPKMYKLLYSITDIKRAHVAKLGADEELHVHADRPYQEGMRIIINLTGGSNTTYNFYGTEFKINAGEIFWVNSGVPHCLYNYGELPRINLLIDVKFKENLKQELDAIVSNLKSLGYVI